MSTTFSISGSQCCPDASVWGVNWASYSQYVSPGPEPANQYLRRGPDRTIPDNDIVSKIAQLIEDSPFHGEGFHKMWARLSYKRISTS